MLVEEAEEKGTRKHCAGGSTQKKPGGWKAMPYILGNETFERLATFGLFANFQVYLTRELHVDQVSAANIMSIWYGVTNFGPLIGAFLSDTYLGRFNTIAFASFPSLLGMMIVTLTAWLPQLHPPPCPPQQLAQSQCVKPSKTHVVVLLAGLLFLSIGSSGIRPCSIPFGVDQFDASTEEGRKGINSFFNWYYTSFSVVLLLTQTLVVYLQDSVSWTLGFGIPTICMFFSLVMFFVGSRVYVHVKPEGSILSGFAQVLVAAFRKRRAKLPSEEDEVDAVFYDPPLNSTVVLSRLPLTNQFRMLNKAALIMEDDLTPEGNRANHWRLASVQQVEEVKCLARIFPIWAAGILCLTSMIQQFTFTISQALQMDRHLRHSFQIPAGSITVVSFLTIALCVPIYDRLLVPALRNLTRLETGITMLQRIGIGMLFSVLTMVVAGSIERSRRASALSHPDPDGLGVAPMSVMWLVPQLLLMGLCEGFNIIGQIEFFNRECPEHMRSIANSLLSCSFGVASYVNSLMITTVRYASRTKTKPGWLGNDLNAVRLDYFYYLLAGIGVLNFGYFLFVARRYRYKEGLQGRYGDGDGDGQASRDVELGPPIVAV